jgi:glycosidase
MFHATYDWNLLTLTEKVAEGEATVEELHEHIQRDLARYGTTPFRLNMITNHDRNAWEGTIQERYGEGAKAFAVFSFTAYGTPLIYSGQEVGLDKRLRFFDKDTVSWADPNNYSEFYRQLNDMKSEHPALWNGAYGGMPTKLDDKNPNVFSFTRSRDSDKVVGIINLSAAEQTVTLSEDLEGFHDAFTQRGVQSSTFTVAPWGYHIFVR